MTMMCKVGGRAYPGTDALQAYFGSSLGHDEGGAFGQFEDMRLRSVFQPLIDVRTLKPMAFEALLRVNGGAIPPYLAFSKPNSAESIVFFDRLCRSIHAVNFA